MVNIKNNSTPSRVFKVSRLRAILLLVWMPLVVIQSLLLFSWANVIAALLVVAGGLIGAFSLDYRTIKRFPISSMMLIGYALYYFWLPPIATALEWKPLTNNLDHPVAVFIHALICQLFFVGGHFLYRHASILMRMRSFIAQRIFVPFGYFRVPTDAHLFAMGVIGLIAMGYQIFIAGAAQQEIFGAANKFMQALYPLAYLPFCLLVRPLLGGSATVKKGSVAMLGIYTAALLIVAMGHNTRAAFLVGIASVIMAYGYGISAHVLSIRVFRARNVVIGVVGLILLIGPIADLATSMVIVRERRSDLPPTALVKQTLETFENKRLIADRRFDDSNKAGIWDERYVDNIYLARLSNLKFPDSSIDLAMQLDNAGKEYLRSVEWQRTLSVLPRPVLALIAPNVDKDFTSGASGGDIMLYTVTNNEYVLGGFRVGSLFGSGFGMFGWMYPLVLGVLVLPIFIIGDAQTLRLIMPSPAGQGWTPALAPMAIVGFFSWFFILTSAATGAEAVSTLLWLILREWIQVFVIYGLAYWSTLVLLKPFERSAVTRPHDLRP